MNIPSIPDNVNKILIFFGIALILYSFNKFETSKSEFKNRLNILDSKIDSIEIVYNLLDKKTNDKQLKINHLFNKLKKDTLNKNEFQNIKNEIIIINQSLNNEINNMLNLLNIQQITIKNKEKEIKEHRNDDIFNLFFIFLIGLLFTYQGINDLTVHQKIQDKILKSQIYEKPFYYDNCQSCGKKFNSIVHYSKNADGTINYSFCKECYSLGAFTEPNLNLATYINRIESTEYYKNISYIKKMNIKIKIKQLDRWNEDIF